MFETKIALGKCPCVLIFNRKMIVHEYFDEELNAMISDYYDISSNTEEHKLAEFKDKFEKRYDFYG